MTVKQREPQHRTVDIDLTQVPFFEPEPLVIKEASGLERVREVVAASEEADQSYRVDRKPQPSDDSMFFGGLGLAATMDVGAHPIRARMRRINVMTIVAITMIAGVAMVFATLVLALKP